MKLLTDASGFKGSRNGTECRNVCHLGKTCCKMDGNAGDLEKV